MNSRNSLVSLEWCFLDCAELALPNKKCSSLAPWDRQKTVPLCLLFVCQNELDAPGPLWPWQTSFTKAPWLWDVLVLGSGNLGPQRTCSPVGFCTSLPCQLTALCLRDLFLAGAQREGVESIGSQVALHHPQPLNPLTARTPEVWGRFAICPPCFSSVFVKTTPPKFRRAKSSPPKFRGCGLSWPKTTCSTLLVRRPLPRPHGRIFCNPCA